MTGPSSGPAGSGQGVVPPATRIGFSAYRLPTLMWVAAQRAVTMHQTLFRFWVLDGRSPSHGYRIVRGLVREGLLESRPLYPELGRASVHVLTPSRAGWRELGLPPRSWPIHRLKEVLQFSHLCLLREATGWTIEPPDRVWPLLRRRALDILRCSPRRLEMAQEARRWIEVMRPAPLGIWALHHAATGQLRLIVNVRTFAGAVRACEQLLSIRLATEAAPLDLELTGGDREQLEEVRSRLAKGFDPRASRGSRRAAIRRSLPALPLVIHMAPDFRAMPHPALVPVRARSVYAEHGVSSPLTLRTASPWMATRAGGVL